MALPQPGLTPRLKHGTKPVKMRRPIRSLPLAVLGGILLLIQVLAIGLGSGTRLCFDPVCADVALVTSDGCCGDGCPDAMPEAPIEDPCVCAWMPITDAPLAELALTVAPVAATIATIPPVLLLMPPTARVTARPTPQRPPPHLSALRCVLLTC